MNARKPLAALLVILGLTPTTLLAVDGVVLIDQNKALAGNLTPGDGPGFPVVINQPGSYRLSGNLTVPDGAAAAIQINADDVSLDLNGFSIRGSGIFPTTLTGINGDDRKRVRLYNGSVSGFVNPIVFQGAAQLLTVENMQVDGRTTSNGQVISGVAIKTGAQVSAGALLRNLTVFGQIQLTCPSLLANVVVRGGIVEMNVPPNGIGLSFPVNCKGENILQY